MAVGAKEVEVNVGDCVLGTAELRSQEYIFKWPTFEPDEEVFRAIRTFVEAVREGIIDTRVSDKPFPKLFPEGVEAFDADGHGIEAPLDEFLDEALFANRIRAEHVVAIRVNTDNADVFYSLRGELLKIRVISVMSHIDLSDQLSPFIIQTHERGLPGAESPRITAALSETLAQYR